MGIEVVCDKVTPNKEPLAINVKRLSSAKNFKSVKKCGYA